MRRIRFGGHVIEFDPNRGTITLRPTWFNRFLVLAIGCLFTAVGLALVYGVFYGEPGIPRKDWTTMNWWAFMALYSFFLGIGLVTSVSGASLVLNTIWLSATGRPTQVLDRREGRCRQGNETLFELDQVVSVGVEYIAEGDSVSAGVRFIRMEGSSHVWLASFPVRKWQCSDLAREAASFLGVPLDGEEDGTEKPSPGLLAEWPDIA